MSELRYAPALVREELTVCLLTDEYCPMILIDEFHQEVGKSSGHVYLVYEEAVALRDWLNQVLP